MSSTPMILEDVLASIAGRANQLDLTGDWPLIDLTQLHKAGAMRWAIPKANGGDELSPLDLHLQYERLAVASVSTALVLTQRDAAAGLIEASTQSPHRADLLNQLANNSIWATVGIAQLTTSRQGGRPAVLAEKIDGGYRINGAIPWCTGAIQADFIVAGAALGDGQQILFLLRKNQPGVLIDPPMQMVSLISTSTSAIELNDVFVEDGWLLRSPCANALIGRRNGLTLGQTFIATGLTQAALNLIATHDSDRARSALGKFTDQLTELRADVASLCHPGREAAASAANARLRGSCNDLAIRAAHAAIALFKGSALLRDHPAQRFAREAMFLLVWSCPNPVIDCTVDLLSNQHSL